MSEPIYCYVWVKVPTTWNKPDEPAEYAGRYGIAADAMVPGMPECIERLRDAGLSEVESEVADDGTTTWRLEGEGNYGLDDSYIQPELAWLQQHHVPYRASSDPKYEFSGEIYVFDGEELHFRDGDGNANATLVGYQWEQMKERHPTVDGHINVAVVAEVEAYFNGMPGLDQCGIDHLPAIEPDSEAAEEAATNAVLEGEVR